jgi:hypothetical protein
MSQHKEYYYYGFNHGDMIQLTYKKLFVNSNENDKLYNITLKRNMWLKLQKEINKQNDEQLWIYTTITQPIKEHHKK